MAGFSASQAALTGFRIVRERPWTVLVWSALQLVASLGMVAFVTLSAGPAATKLIQAAFDQKTVLDPQVQMDLMRDIAPTYCAATVGWLVLSAVVVSAMNRAVLRPQDSAFAYLRLASDELRQLALIVIQTLIFLGICLTLLFVSWMIGAAAANVFGDSVGLSVVAAVLFPGLVSALVFVGVRLSLASPTTFVTGRIDLIASWRLTEGRFWPLLGSFAIAYALQSVVLLASSRIAIAALALAGGSAPAIDGFNADFSSLSVSLAVPQLAYLVVMAVGTALAWPVTMAPPAAILQALGGDREAVRSAYD